MAETEGTYKYPLQMFKLKKLENKRLLTQKNQSNVATFQIVVYKNPTCILISENKER